MDERPRPPRNLKAMLSEAKDTSELMVDLGYASLFFADTRMADEVTELENVLTRAVVLSKGEVLELPSLEEPPGFARANAWQNKGISEPVNQRHYRLVLKRQHIKPVIILCLLLYDIFKMPITHY